ncbi:hypothetical protein NHQ30_010603 [Ciborinia camelliae]|nr:hypothetical protein NHQ30_010603 [Ciborinia camelliae]
MVPTGSSSEIASQPGEHVAAIAEYEIPIEISSSGDETPAPPSPDFERGFRFWCIIIGLGITNLLGALENTVVSTAAPVILSDLQLGQNFIWITNAFFVCSAAFQPLFGQLCNVFGRRWIAMAIVAIFVLGSGICGAANSGGMLIAGRAVQGMGSGGIIMIIVSDLVPLRERGNYMAVVLAIYGIGVSLGPFIGGAIVSSTTWRWVFYLNLPIGGTSLLVLYLFLHVNHNKDMTFAQKLKRIDILGNLILMAGTVAILYALSISNPWSSWHKLVPLILGFLALFLFAGYEASGIPSEPVMPPRLFTTRTSVLVSINTFLNSALLFWVMFFLPVYFQSVALDSPRRTGVALLPYSLVGIPGAAISAMALSRWGKFRPLHFAGFALFTISLGLFSLQREETSTAEWATYQCVFALGAGMVLNTLLPAFQAPASEADQAAATATWCFIRTCGSVWGVAIPAAIFNNRVAALRDQLSNKNIREQLAHGSAYQIAAAQFIDRYPLPVQAELRAVYREALQRVWQIAVVFAGLACVLVWLEDEIPLRTVLDTEYGLKLEARESPINSRNEKRNDVEGNRDG